MEDGSPTLVVKEDEEDFIDIPGWGGIRALVPPGSRPMRVVRAID